MRSQSERAERIHPPMVVKRVGVWVGKESAAGLLVLGLGEAVKLLLQHLGVGASFLASSSAPIWLIAIGIIGGLAWVLWPPRHAPQPIPDASAPRNTDEVTDLKRKVTEQTEAVYQANVARDEMRAERDACKKNLQEMTAQRDHVEGQWKTLLREMDVTMAPRNIADQLADERNALQRRLDGITPLVNLYRSVVSITARLQAYRNDMEDIPPTGNVRDDIAQLTRVAEKTQRPSLAIFGPTSFGSRLTRSNDTASCFKA